MRWNGAAGGFRGVRRGMFVKRWRSGISTFQLTSDVSGGVEHSMDDKRIDIALVDHEIGIFWKE